MSWIILSSKTKGINRRTETAAEKGTPKHSPPRLKAQRAVFSRQEREKEIWCRIDQSSVKTSSCLKNKVTKSR